MAKKTKVEEAKMAIEVSNDKNSEWYNALVEECKALITELRFNVEDTLIKGYHELGKLIREHSEDMKISDLVCFVARDIGMSERNVWYSVQFVDKYPDLDKLPEGKAITWTKVKKMLTTSKPIEECLHENIDIIHICHICGKKIK